MDLVCAGRVHAPRPWVTMGDRRGVARAIAALGFWLRVGSVRATSSQRSQHSLGHYSNKY